MPRKVRPRGAETSLRRPREGMEGRIAFPERVVRERGASVQVRHSRRKLCNPADAISLGVPAPENS